MDLHSLKYRNDSKEGAFHGGALISFLTKTEHVSSNNVSPTRGRARNRLTVQTTVRIVKI